MTAARSVPRGILGRLVQVAALVATALLLHLAVRLVPVASGGVSAIAAVGFLLLSGSLLAELIEPFGLPHLTGYLLAGVLAGPQALGLVDHEAVRVTSEINALALALIAVAGGAELELAMLRSSFRSIAWSTLLQHSLVAVVSFLAFVALRDRLPFLAGRDTRTVVAVSLLYGVLAASRSPAAVLGVLAETRARGPLATRTLATVMTSDLVVVVLLALATAIARPLLEPSATLSLSKLTELGRELLGSVSVGVTLGLVLVAYLRFVDKQLVLVLIGLGSGFSVLVEYLHFEPLLTFLSAGFVVRNLSSYGERLLHAVSDLGSLVFVIFFATAGAHLDLAIVARLFPLALLLVVVRAVSTWVAARAASRLADDPPNVKRFAAAGLVSQAGLTLGMVAILDRQFPVLRGGFSALAIACVALNELVGPVVFKWALDRAGETVREPGRLIWPRGIDAARGAYAFASERDLHADLDHAVGGMLKNRVAGSALRLRNAKRFLRQRHEPDWPSESSVSRPRKKRRRRRCRPRRRSREQRSRMLGDVRRLHEAVARDTW